MPDLTCELESKFKYHLLCGASLTLRIRPFPADTNLHLKVLQKELSRDRACDQKHITLLNFAKPLSLYLSDRLECRIVVRIQSV